MTSQATATATTPRRSPLTEVIENWRESCLRPNPVAVGPEGGGSTSSVGTTRSAAELQQDAKTFFRYISKNTQTDAGGGRMLTTRSSHEEALAQLIQHLGPAFQSSPRSSSQTPRLRALHLLLGALEGCQSTGSTATMSNGCLRLVGNFLTAHCGPIDLNSGEDEGDDEDDVDYDDMGDDLETNIRDTAIQALTALVELVPSLSATAISMTAGQPQRQQHEGGQISPASDAAAATEAIELRTVLAQTGVEKRCALPSDDTGMMDTGYSDETQNATDIRGGLSTLPRSKRSLCFALLRSSVKGVSQVTSTVIQLHQDAQNLTHKPILASISSKDDVNVRRYLIRFTNFATSCIIGESDPRCLLQLLEVLHSVQSSFGPWFGALTIQADEAFPNEDVFDAVVPYYPIQFTPPPNNPHGITREGLHSELLAVLTCTDLDAVARSHQKPTMLSLTFNLLLEPLLPAEDDSPTTHEKFEALEALNQLLFPSSSCTTSECRNLAIDEVRALSSAMQLTHDEASRGVSLGGEKGEQNKILADQCRVFISKVGVDLEKTDLSNSRWAAFVAAPLDKDMRKMKLSPSYCKTSIAYAACLAASGGPKTLRTCLLKGLQPLLEYLEENKVETEDSIAAIHGCAAFFSSCQVAIGKSIKEGVRLCPHPLEPYAARSCDLLLSFVERKDADYSWSMKLALTTSLQCLLDVSTKDQLGNEQLLSRICGFFIDLRHTVSNFDMPTTYKQDYLRSQQGYSMAMGSFIGKSATEYTGNDDGSVFHSQQVKDCMKDQVIPGLMTSCKNDERPQDSSRFDRKALSVACSYSGAMAELVVQRLLESLLEALKVSFENSSVSSSLLALSSIIGDSNDCNNALRAFHTSDIPDQILSLLSADIIATGTTHRQSLVQLALPETSEEHRSVISKMNNVDMIVRGLLPAYRRPVPEEKILSLLISVVDKIPPLSSSDEGFLFVRLPVLSVALQSCTANDLDRIYAKACDADESTKSFLDGLSEFVLSDTNFARTKSAATTCVYALVKGGINRDHDCPVISLTTKAMEKIMTSVSANDIDGMNTGISYLSLLGAAAALRGYSSSSTAAAIATFLVDVACSKSASFSLPSLPQISPLDLTEIADDASRDYIQMVCSSGYGSILMEGSLKQLMRQRLVHICLTHINTTYNSERGQALTGESIASPPIGVLLIACHIISATDINKGDSSTTRKLATIVVEGLSSDLFQLTPKIAKKFPCQLKTTRTFILSAILKLICIAPASVNGLMLTMVSGLLRAFAVSDSDSEVASKLLALQALEQLAQMDGARTSILAVKPAVVALLASAMNQKSSILRSAAVDVRNAWCIVN